MFVSNETLTLFISLSNTTSPQTFFQNGRGRCSKAYCFTGREPQAVTLSLGFSITDTANATFPRPSQVKSHDAIIHLSQGKSFVISSFCTNKTLQSPSL